MDYKPENTFSIWLKFSIRKNTFTGAFQANGNGGWQTIGNTEPMTIPENGYLAVYLSNASDFAGCSSCLASEGDVYFDHLEITFTHGHLKEENGYYPFGLPMAGQSSSALGMTPNRQKYQSNEYITEAGLNWMSFGARQYDPQLGRFLSVDPLAAAGGQESNSPYEAMGDEPVSETDPGGMQPQDYATTTNFSSISVAGEQVGSPTNGYFSPAINPINFGIMNAIGTLNDAVATEELAERVAIEQAEGVLNKTTGAANNQIYAVSSGYSKEELKQMGASEDPDGYWHTWIETKPGDLSSLTRVTLMGTGHVLTTYYNADGSIYTGPKSLETTHMVTDAVGTALGVQNSVIEMAGESVEGLKFVKGMKFAGRGVAGLSGALDLTEVGLTGKLKPSNVLDAVVTGVAFIPVVGDALAGAYFLSDLITEGITGETIEENIDNSSWGQNHTYTLYKTPF